MSEPSNYILSTCTVPNTANSLKWLWLQALYFGVLLNVVFDEYRMGRFNLITVKNDTAYDGGGQMRNGKTGRCSIGFVVHIDDAKVGIGTDGKKVYCGRVWHGSTSMK